MSAPGRLKTLPVKAGQPLFQIDPAPYENARAEAKARAEQAAREEARLKGLVAQQAVSRMEYDNAVSVNAMAQAALKQALRIAATQESLKADTDFSASANLLRCYDVGRWEQYARSGFKREPLGQWPMQWPMLYCACLSQSAAPVRRKQ